MVELGQGSWEGLLTGVILPKILNRPLLPGGELLLCSSFSVYSSIWLMLRPSQLFDLKEVGVGMGNLLFTATSNVSF